MTAELRPDWAIFAGGSPPEVPLPPEPHDDQPPPPDGPADEHPPRERNDDGNALRLVDQYQDQIRYCPQRAAWLVWNGWRWAWDHAGVVNEHARRVARELPRHTDPDRKWRVKSLMRERISAMQTLARTDDRIVINVAALDARPYELNTPGGVINLRTGRIRPGTPDAMHTRSTAVAPNPGLPPDRWLRFLADTFAGNPALTTYVQRLLGLSLVGAILEQVMPFAYGAGANGKTTLLGVVQRLAGLGDDGYSISAPAELLTASRFEAHPTEIARLAGARLVVTSETEEGQRFAEAKVKKLTGRDTLTGRFMARDFFDFTPSHTLWLLANHQPNVATGGDAFWRRIKLVPFDHVVPAEARDPHLEDTLVEAEGPQILAWLIAGAADYFASGLHEPESVARATTAYQRDQDTVARFVEERAIVGEPNQPGLRVQASKLHAAYEDWCRQEGDDPVSQRAFTFALRAKYGVATEKSRTGRFYAGVRLDDIDPGDQDPPPPAVPTQPAELPWPGYPGTPPDPTEGWS